MRFELESTCAAIVALLLQGCGAGGGNSSTPAPPSPTPSPSPAPSPSPSPSPLVDGAKLVEIMNDEYNGYKVDDPSSPVGNFIRYTEDRDNLYYCGGNCYDGKPDCKVSGSVLNYKNMIDNGQPSGWFNYQRKDLSGFYIASSKLDSLFKCAYAWDGASDGKVNKGCGCPQTFAGWVAAKACTEGTKDFNYSAYNNKVPPEFVETSSANSDNVKPCYCDEVEKSGQPLPADAVGSMCYYKGPAFDPAEESPNELHKMLKRRVENQKNGDVGYGPAITSWNEVNLDGNLVDKALEEDPTGVIVALVYSSQMGTEALENLKVMNQNFMKKYKLGKPLPMIYLNRSANVTKGDAKPWVFKPEDQLNETATLLV